MAAAATVIAVTTRDWVGQESVSTQELSEQEIIDRAREGDHEAFRVLVSRHQDRVYGLALRILRDPEQARDAAQDAFLKAYRALGRFEGRSKFGTWMYRLTYNHCLDLKRADKSQRHVEWDEERTSSALPESETASSFFSGLGPGPEAAMERSQLRSRLLDALAGLPEETRQILLMREAEGMSYREIASILGIPKGTVMSRLYNARRRAREALREAGVEPPSGARAAGGNREGEES